jgi:hypothetical protein
MAMGTRLVVCSDMNIHEKSVHDRTNLRVG